MDKTGAVLQFSRFYHLSANEYCNICFWKFNTVMINRRVRKTDCSGKLLNSRIIGKYDISRISQLFFQIKLR